MANSLRDASVLSPLSDQQVKNNAGGYVYALSSEDRLRRFLILGSDANNFYVGAKELTLQNAQVIKALIESGKAMLVVEEAVKVSVAGRAAKQGAALFALAMVARLGDAAAKKAAIASLPKVCRTASTLYEWHTYHKAIGLATRKAVGNKSSGWGRGLRTGVSNWFLEKSPKDLALQLTKYVQRNGWSGRDLLRLSHPDASKLKKRKREDDEDDMRRVFAYAVKPAEEVKGDSEVASFLRAAYRLKQTTNENEALELMRQHRFGWEHIGDTYILKSAAIWKAFLDSGMGLTALIRNLNRFIELGIFDRTASITAAETAMAGLSVQQAKIMEANVPVDSRYLDLVCKRLTDVEGLKAARVHPLRVLMASRTLSKKQPDAPKQLMDALDSAFELSFQSVEPTGKKIMLAVDVSGSMSSGTCAGTDCLTPREAASAVAMMLVRREANVQTFAFSTELMPFPISKTDSLDRVMFKSRRFHFGGTDCAAPMVYARQHDMDVDAFIVLTDSETWAGNHPVKELQLYRKSRRRQAREGDAEPAAEKSSAKLLVLAFSSTGFSIADPEDKGMLDVAGLDASVPEIMRSFVIGEL